MNVPLGYLFNCSRSFLNCILSIRALFTSPQGAPHVVTSFVKGTLPWRVRNAFSLFSLLLSLLFSVGWFVHLW